MSQAEWLILVGIGGFFVVLGIVLVVRGKRAEGNYRDSLSDRPDLRRFVEHEPQPRFDSLRVGGWVAVVVGVVLLGIGIGLHFWG